MCYVASEQSGKSFFLNFLLKFLQSNGHTDPQWLRRQFEGGCDDSTPSNGFEWMGGAERKTIGIWVWSEPIVVRTDGGKEVAVLLMDTQGSFDGQTTFADNALIFATSVWLSSLFIYNLKDDLSEDKLQFLEYFSDFSNGIQGMEGATGLPLFQHLLLLIRDWAWPQNYTYGWHSTVGQTPEGSAPSGGNYTADFLYGTPGQSEEGLAARRDIAAKFSTMSSFLLPHPGLPVAQNATSTLTSVDLVEPLFVQHFQDLLAFARQEILKPKVMYGQVQTGRSMLAIMQKWAQLLDSQEIPQAKSLTQATAKASLEMLLHRTEKLLNKKLLDDTAKGMPAEAFEMEMTAICNQVLDRFIELSSGFPKYQMQYIARLEETMKNGAAAYVQLNASKRTELEQGARIRAMQRESENMNGKIREQNSLMKNLQRDLETQKNLSQQEKAKLENQVEQVREETAAMIRMHENELQEQQRHARELETRILDTERRELEFMQRMTMPQQYREETGSSLKDTLPGVLAALMPVVVEGIKYLATQPPQKENSEDEDED